MDNEKKRRIDTRVYLEANGWALRSPDMRASAWGFGAR